MYSWLLRNALLPYALRRDNRESALRYWKEYEASQFWPAAKLRDYQWQRLKSLLRYSYENCPYYKDIFRERDLTPESFNDFNDIQKLPLLTKDIIFEQGDRLLSSDMDAKDMMKFPTGGTTGQQAFMHRDQDSFNRKLAIEWRHEAWMGKRPCNKMAYFWPAHIDIHHEDSLKSKLKNRLILRQMIFNAGSINRDIALRFYNKLKRFKPGFLKVFPASFYIFAEFLEVSKLKPLAFKGIMSCGEPLYDFQRQKFESLFACPVFDMYGAREAGNTSSECSAHKGMHIASEIAYVEFLSNGKQVDYGQEGEIVITDLTNYCMPLIRYRIDDFGIPLKDPCSCGRSLPLMGAVVGRLSDDFWGPGGTKHNGTMLAYHLTVVEEGIAIGQVQFIQKSLSTFLVRVTRKPEPTSATFEYLARRMKDILGDSIDISFEVVDQIPREKSGKIRYVKCEMDPPPIAKSG